MGELTGQMAEGLMSLAVATGLQVMSQVMEADVEALAGPRGRRDKGRTAVRHGSGPGLVTLGGRRVPVVRPRVRAADGSGELPVPAYDLFSSTELLGRLAMEKMVAGLSTRRYPVALESRSASGGADGEVDVEVGGVAPVRRGDPDGAGAADGRGPVGGEAGRVDDRRGALRRPPVHRRAGHRHRQREASVGAGGGLDGEHHPGP